MRQTLFYIPPDVLGVPLFGFGLLFAVWLVASVLILVPLVRRHGFSPETVSQLFVLAVVGAAIVFVVPGLAGPRGLPIRGFGMMLLVAVAAAYGLAAWRARRMGLDPELLAALAFWLFIPGIAGARLYYVVEKWDQFERATLGETARELLNITKGGLVVYGSILGGLAGFILFVRKYRPPTLVLCDLVAPSLMLGLALGRIGCFLNGCCFGGPCESALGVAFPWRSPPHLNQVESGQLYLHGLLLGKASDGSAVIQAVEQGSEAASQGLRPGQRIVAVYDPASNRRLVVRSLDDARALLLDVYGEGEGRIGLWEWLLQRDKALARAYSSPTRIEIETSEADRPARWRHIGPPPRSLPVYPTQLLSAIDALVICFFLLAHYPFRQWDGQSLALLGSIYPVSRILMEYVRVDEPPVFLGLKTSQVVSFVLLAATCVFWIYLSRQKRLTPDEPRGADPVGV